MSRSPAKDHKRPNSNIYQDHSKRIITGSKKSEKRVFFYCRSAPTQRKPVQILLLSTNHSITKSSYIILLFRLTPKLVLNGASPYVDTGARAGKHDGHVQGPASSCTMGSSRWRPFENAGTRYSTASFALYISIIRWMEHIHGEVLM